MNVNRFFLFATSIFFLFLLAGIVCAENKVIYDEDIYADQKAITPLGTFDFRYYLKGDLPILAVSSDDFRTILDLGECKQQGIYIYCFDGREFGRIDYEKDIEIPIISFRIEELVPTITRTVSPNELLIGEKATVTVTMSAPGNIRPRITYIDQVPPQLRPKDLSTGQIIANAVRWEGILDEEMTITYSLELMDNYDGEFDATLIYDIDGTDQTIKAPSISVKKKSLMDIDADFTEDELEVGDLTDMELTIDKNTEEDLTLHEFFIQFPANIEVTNYSSEFSKTGNKFKLNLPKLRDQEEYKFTLKATSYSKEYPIIINADLESDEEDELLEKKIILESAIKDLSLSLSLPSTVSLQNKFKLKANFMNRNEKTSFYNINCEIKGEFFNKKYSFKQSLPDKQTNIEDTEIVLEDLSQRNVTHTFVCAYETEDGSRLSSNSTKTTMIDINMTKIEEEKREEEEARLRREERDKTLEGEQEEDAELEETDIEETPQEIEEVKEEKKIGFFTKLGRTLKRIFTFWKK